MKSKNILAILSVLALSAPMASAADWYAGVGGGRSNYNGNELGLEPTRLASEVYTLNNLETVGTGWKLFAGRMLNENWAVEVAYTKLGRFWFDANILSGPGPGPFPTNEIAEAKPDCWSLSGVGSYPLGNNFSLLGKAGICKWADHALGYEGGISYNLEAFSEGYSLTYGIGAKYDFADNLGVRAEWERFEKVVHKHDSADLLSISLQYGF